MFTNHKHDITEPENQTTKPSTSLQRLYHYSRALSSSYTPPSPPAPPLPSSTSGEQATSPLSPAAPLPLLLSTSGGPNETPQITRNCLDTAATNFQLQPLHLNASNVLPPSSQNCIPATAPMPQKQKSESSSNQKEQQPNTLHPTPSPLISSSSPSLTSAPPRQEPIKPITTIPSSFSSSLTSSSSSFFSPNLIGQQSQYDLQNRENTYVGSLQHGLDDTVTLLEDIGYSLNRGLRKKFAAKWEEFDRLAREKSSKEKLRKVHKELVEMMRHEHRIYYIDKIYSTNRRSLRKIYRAIGTWRNVLELPHPPRPAQYDKNLDEHIDKFYERIRQDMAMNKNARKLILLDDGGHLISRLPDDLAKKYYCYGVEQTMSGHKKLIAIPPKCRWISVATSNLKRLEDPSIGEAATRRIQETIKTLEPTKKPQDLTCGIIGTGFVGTAVAQALVAAGYKVCFYDAKDKQALTSTEKCTSPEDLIRKSDLVIGCTGEDSLRDVKLEECITKPTYFFSCSSRTVEFESFLKKYKLDPEQERTYKNNSTQKLCYKITNKQQQTYDVIFAYGGYPINFNTTQGFAVPGGNDPTITALYLAVRQWIGHIPCKTDKDPKACKEPTELNPEVQKITAEKWQEIRISKQPATPEENDSPRAKL